MSTELESSVSLLSLSQLLDGGGKVGGVNSSIAGSGGGRCSSGGDYESFTILLVVPAK